MDNFLYHLADKIVLILLLLFAVVAEVSRQILRYRKRVLVNRERLAAIEKGCDLPPDVAPVLGLPPQVCLMRGLLWLFIGAAFFLCMMGVALLMSGEKRLLSMAWGFAGAIPMGIGAAYLFYYRLQRRQQ